MTELPGPLTAALRRILPGARLALRRLPQASPIRLALLSEVGFEQPIDAATAQRVMDNPLYWVFCWASGQVLAAHVLAHPELVAGKRVLDFGAGSGVVAIAAALAGAREVIACDVDPLALRASAHNAAQNGVQLRLCPDFSAVAGELDLIVAADVLYDRDNLPWLDAFTARAAAVLVADSRLRHFAHDSYRRVARRTSSTVPALGESAEFGRVSLYAAGPALPGF